MNDLRASRTTRCPLCLDAQMWRDWSISATAEQPHRRPLPIDLIQPPLTDFCSTGRSDRVGLFLAASPINQTLSPSCQISACRPFRNKRGFPGVGIIGFGCRLRFGSGSIREEHVLTSGLPPTNNKADVAKTFHYLMDRSAHKYSLLMGPARGRRSVPAALPHTVERCRAPGIFMVATTGLER